MARLFLNYRRDDAAGSAEHLYRELATHFGAQEVFFDHAAIEPGVDFDDGVDVDALGSVDVFLALIGPRWFQPGPDGQRRIDNPHDQVRLEIEAALGRDIRVIPVLVGGASMPNPEELPEPLQPLTDRKPFHIRDPSREQDIALLLRQLDAVIAGPPRAPFEPAPFEEREAEAMNDPLIGERRIGRMLREAALAGVVPASAFAAPPSPAPEREPAPFPEEPLPESEPLPERAPVPEEPRREARRTPPAPMRQAEPVGRLRLLVPLLALLGAGVVVAKWLLGWFVQPVDLPESSGDTVVCTVFAPPSAAPGDSILVQAFAHLPEQAGDARAIAMELDTDARRRTFQSLEAPVPLGARLHFELRMPGLEVDDPVASLVWRRRAEAVQFGVRVPSEALAGTVIGTLEISLDSAPVGHVKFKLAVDRGASGVPSEPQGERAWRYTAAFISYASRDREKVLARVQMLSIVGIRYFHDVLSLEPGDRWERKLELGIDECDLFLLFWSSESKQSEWVRREVRYALDRSGGNELSPPEIRPVLLEGPPIVEPWEELAHLHFNDRLLYFMRPPHSA